jgi:DNA (cytosine-5)-methyltransferase 1
MSEPGPLVLSLFPGIGLLDRAFEQEGFCVVRGPDVIWGGDIRTFHPPAGVFAGVIGGPPCQSFSPLANMGRAQGRQPVFGNLIPEYERCVSECEPQWYIMENVRDAPEPCVDGYSQHGQLLNNRWLGEEQNRLRRITFGIRGFGARLDIETCALEPAMYAPAVTSTDGGGTIPMRPPTVTSNVGGIARSRRQWKPGTVTAAHQGHGKGPPRMWRYSLEQACELQGVPPGHLDHSPFTAAGKLKAIANGVPLAMGLAIARAVRAATK